MPWRRSSCPPLANAGSSFPVFASREMSRPSDSPAKTRRSPRAAVGPHRDAAIHAAGRPDPLLGLVLVGIELPDLLSGRGIQRDHFGACGRDIHHAVHDHRRTFDRGSLGGIARVIDPGHLQVAARCPGRFA